VWRVEAARAGPIAIAYGAYVGGSPSEIRLVAETGAAGSARLLLRLAQVEVNPDFPEDAFHLKVPDGVRPLTLEELRRRGLGPGQS
jgi:hypothetical protein